MTKCVIHTDIYLKSVVTIFLNALIIFIFAFNETMAAERVSTWKPQVYVDTPIAKPKILSSTCVIGKMPESFSFANLVHTAICNRPDIRAQAFLLEENANDAESALLKMLPTITGDITANAGNQSTSSTNNSRINFSTATRGVSATAQLTWTVFDFGLTLAKLKESTYKVYQDNSDYDVTIITAIQEIGENWINLLYYRDLVYAHRDTLNILEKNLKTAKGRALGGAGTQSDYYQASANYRQELAQVEDDIVSLQGATINFCKSIGLYCDVKQVDTVTSGMKLYDLRHIDINQVNLFNDLYKEKSHHNPRYMSYEYKYLQAIERLEQERAAYMPSVQLSGSLSGNDAYPNSTYLYRGFYKKSQLTAGVTMHLPFSDFLESRPALRSAQSAANSYKYKRDEAELEIITSLRKNFSDLSGYINKERFEAGAQEDWEHALALDTKRYQNGIGGLQEVITASQNLDRTNQSRLDALRSENNAAIEIIAEGWEP